MRNYISIRFVPRIDIKKSINGQRSVYFFAGVMYHGVVYIDGAIVAYSPICDKTIFIDEKHISIEKN